MNILVTAGPTQEPIDPVRFISNRSTGEMGFALAKAALKRGHKVILVSGPVSIAPPEGAQYFSVRTAQEMLRRVSSEHAKADAVIMSAAVCDYMPAKISKSKTKKTKDILNLKLIKNPDILKALGERKKNKILIGFALETENLFKNAAKKLKEKNLDLIIANQLTKKQNVFGKNKTSVLMLDKDGNKKYLSSVSKSEVAGEIIRRIENLMTNDKAQNSK